MKPIYKTNILQGHSRPIKNLRFSKSGSVVYSASADRQVIKWDIITNQKLFTYPHQTCVNVICISPTDVLMLTGDSTGCIYIWDTTQNILLNKIEFESCLNVRSVQMSTDSLYVIVTLASRAKNSSSFVNAYTLQSLLPTPPPTPPIEEQTIYTTDNTVTPITTANTKQQQVPPYFKQFICGNVETKYVQSKFTNYNKSIVISREDGGLELINFENNHLISSNSFHKETILDFDIDFEHGIILTASKDGYLSVINLNTFQLIRQFHPQNPTRNLNACCICVVDNPYYVSNNKDAGKISLDNLFDVNADIDDLFGNASSQLKYGKQKEIIIAITSGGQDSRFVTTTNQKEGGFDIILYNAMNGEELASFLDHFGPVNALAVNGNTLASGAEDATVRLHKIDHYLFNKKT